jgi:hypothetical protein
MLSLEFKFGTVLLVIRAKVEAGGHRRWRGRVFEELKVFDFVLWYYTVLFSHTHDHIPTPVVNSPNTLDQHQGSKPSRYGDKAQGASRS